MRKLFLPLLLCIFMMPGLAHAEKSKAANLYGDLNLVTQYREVRDTSNYMYAGVRGSLSFLNWKNKYKD